MSLFYTHSHYHLLRMKEMGRIYWCHSVGAFGISLAALFVPIYLLKIGFSFSDVLVYLFLSQLFCLVFQYMASISMQYIRPHHMMIIGSFWYIVLFGMLLTQNSYGWPLVLLSLAWALNRTYYWTAFHYSFSLARRHRQGGVQVAGINSLIILSTTAAPAIGGIIATIFGVNYIYSLAIIFIIFGCLPMFNKVEGPEVAKLQLNKQLIIKMRRDIFADFFNGMAGAVDQGLWPIFIFIIVTSYAGIGILSSVIAVAGIFTAIYVGRREEERGEHHYIKRGSFAYSLSSLGRGLAQNTSQIFGLNLLAGLGRSLYVTPFLNRYYTNSEGDHRLGYVTLMEMAFVTGGATLIGGLLLLSVFLSAKAVMIVGFSIAAVAITGVRLIR
jgi:hypothetical protein